MVETEVATPQAEIKTAPKVTAQPVAEYERDRERGIVRVGRPLREGPGGILVPY